MTAHGSADHSTAASERHGAGTERRRASQARLDSLSPAKRALLAKRLAGRSAETDDPTGLAATAEGLPTASGRRNGPLSFAEERFWMAYMFEDRSPAYHVPLTLRLKGALDVPVLAEALRTVVARHGILRTRYPVGPEGEPTAVVDEPGPFDLPVVDRAGQDPQALIDRVSAEPFDLETGPLIRPLLLRAADDEHYLHVTLHHIVTDAWSIGILLHELTTAYNAGRRGVRPSLPELTVQYRDHALWQRAQAERFARQTEYWRRALRGAPRELGLPTDRPRPRQRQAQAPGRHFTVTFPKDAALGLAQRTGTTLFMVLLTAYSAVLGRAAGREDVVVGTPVAGRGNSAVEPLIGCFINTLAMRTDLSGDPTFGELLARVREWTLRAYDNQDVPFQHVAEQVAERGDGRTSLFQVWLALQNVPDAPLEMAGLAVEELADAVEATKFDVTFHVIESGDHLGLRAEYDTWLFEEDTVRGFADEFTTLITAAAADPARRLSELAGARVRT
ncbi:hypothetical protein GCM10010517_63310 [Streptosporangium fragile]|uniref:Condensation domain-containing protein n=1 Tax=Streptosporangium fragile TaxID=46186 RepID=A0ABN3W693_9ACTN